MTHCPSCKAKKPQPFYVCITCWRCLPAPARRALYRKDKLASSRLGELYRQLQAGVPISEIEVTP